MRVRVSAEELTLLKKNKCLGLNYSRLGLNVTFEIKVTHSDISLSLTQHGNIMRFEISEEALTRVTHTKGTVQAPGLPALLFEVDRFSKEKRRSLEQAIRL